MQIQLIKGRFNSKDAINIITQMVHVKIKFHEGKITVDSNEEDIKVHEKRIKELQASLFEIRKELEAKGKQANLHASIEIE